MGNSILNIVTKEMVNFSNSVTKPLYCGILIEGSSQAKTNWEKRLMVFFAEKNQNLIGLGIAGIDITELEWNAENFENQKEWLAKIVESSYRKKSYNKFVFNLNEEIAETNLKEIAHLIKTLDFSQTAETNFKYFFEPPEKITELCQEHNIYLNYFNVPTQRRCMICDQSYVHQNV